MADPPPAPALEGLDEAALVRCIDATLAEAGARVDLTDDCAALPWGLVTTDTLVEGVHFDLARDTARQVGAQAAVANLSDLAASGGAADWLVWSLVLPGRWTRADLVELTRGFVEVAVREGARVVGGNLGRTAGSAVVAVTAGGALVGARPLTRAGAEPGHGVYLSGPLGDAALGVVEPDAEARAARHGWRPHLAEARRLAEWGGVSAMMDVSDGLLLDAHRLARASGVGLELTRDVPVTDLYRARQTSTELALRGGEDYVLLFTAAETPPLGHRIGRCVATPGLWLDGEPAAPAGYQQFARGPA